MRPRWVFAPLNCNSTHTTCSVFLLTVVEGSFLLTFNYQITLTFNAHHIILTFNNQIMLTFNSRNIFSRKFIFIIGLFIAKHSEVRNWFQLDLLHRFFKVFVINQISEEKKDIAIITSFDLLDDIRYSLRNCTKM